MRLLSGLLSLRGCLFSPNILLFFYLFLVPRRPPLLFAFFSSRSSLCPQAVFAGGRLANGTFSAAVDIFASNKSEFVTTTSWATATLAGGARAGLLGVSGTPNHPVAVL
jgi:hypothetical protein